MALIIKNQQNNWAYVMVVAGIAFAVGGFVIFYSLETIDEINTLSSAERYLEKIDQN